MQGNRGKIRQWAVAWACTKISRQSHEITVISWNELAQTDRTTPNSEKLTCMLIGVAISRDRNVINKKAEKFLK
jgi:hypothetical protein